MRKGIGNWRIGMALVLLMGAAGCGNKDEDSNAKVEKPMAAAESDVATTKNRELTLLNVSYDPTRELYQEYNAACSPHYWKEKTGQTVNIAQSHGGAGKQARAVIDGLAGRRGHPGPGLRHRRDRREGRPVCRPTGRSACRTTVAPTPRPSCSWSARETPRGSRTGIDLVKPGVQVITPNPEDLRRGSLELPGGLGLRPEEGTRRSRQAERSRPGVRRWPRPQKKALELRHRTVQQDVPVLDSGARGSTNTFVQRGIGDVLLAWENEAFLAVNELGPDKFDIVVPSISILAEPPVTVVDKWADKHGTREVAEAYLEYLYSPVGQRLAAKHYYRPVKPEDADPEDMKRFPEVELVRIDEVFGGWAEGPEDPFRRRRRVRPDLRPGRQDGSAWRAARTRRRAVGAARFRADAGLSRALPEPDRADPAVGLVLQDGARLGWRGFWETVTYAPRAGVLPADLRGLARGRDSSTPSSAWCVAWMLVRYSFPGQACCRRGRRPAVCPADRRLGHRPDHRLRPQRLDRPVAGAAGDQGRLLAAGSDDRADVHRPAVRRPDAAAGPGGSRPGGGRSGRQPRRRPLADVLAGDPAGRSCRPC